jgi:uncharacterized protein
MIKDRTRLLFKGIAEIVGGDGMGAITLTDTDEKRVLCIVCDSQMKQQIGMRNSLDFKTRGRLLPEVLTTMLATSIGMERYEIEIYDLVNGEYMTMITDKEDLSQYRIRLSDAILLTLVYPVPLYISNELMRKQSAPYAPGTDKLAIPLNALDTDKLKEELKRAVDSENYRLASYINEELRKRHDMKDNTTKDL